MIKHIQVVAAGLALAALVGGCGDSAPQAASVKKADPTKDKLAQVQARGTLIGYTDPEYPPQSLAVKGAQRPADTKCAANQLTAPEITGYDAETTKLVAKGLGVEACFVTPDWGTEVTTGNWGDRWDIAYGSGAVEFSRMEDLYVTNPYYTTPTPFFVPAASKAKTPADLDGKKVGACAGCTMEKYLRGTLKLPGPPLEELVKDPQIVTYDNEIPGLAATAKKKIAAFLCSEPVGEGAIKDGEKLRALPQPAYYSFKTGYVDKKSGLDVGRFVAKVDEVVAGIHADGSLGKLSKKFFGNDYAAKAAQFDMAGLEQTVQ
jgi:polar amino acid transport system substrate-binding protein